MKTLESFPHARGARCSGQAGKSVSIACYALNAVKISLVLFVVLALKRVVFIMINYLYHLLHLILKMPALCLDACSHTTSPLPHCMHVQQFRYQMPPTPPPVLLADAQHLVCVSCTPLNTKRDRAMS